MPSSIRPEWIGLLKNSGACMLPDVTDWSQLPQWQLEWALFNTKGTTQEQRDEISAVCGCWLYLDEDGQRHRDGGPAVIMADGYEMWYQHGLRHRDISDDPAVTRTGGEAEFWVNGERVFP